MMERTPADRRVPEAVVNASLRRHAGCLAKRYSDVLLAGVGLLLSTPIWSIIAFAVKYEDGGPIFYAQQRVGRHGREFKSWKFRSMIVAAGNAVHAVQATEHDTRITRIGRFLRATALDEIPQLWNILRGDMSFVGPRALAVAETEVHGPRIVVPIADIPGYHARHQVAPGLTGVAQIYADRDIPRRHKFRYDLIYIRRQSFLLDMRLIALSFWITFRGKWEHRGGKVGVSPRRKGKVRSKDVLVRARPA